MPKRSKDILEEYTDYERAIAQAMGARVQARRGELRLTQAQVRAEMTAARVPITRTQFSRIENGESLLNAAELIALASVLGVSCRWLLEGERPAEGEG
ncbi:MAG: helix-turn-helix domain-containing protein [Chloroflexales bacterium]|nr:helix-turn-helix domain-containing protein [Chloroflexales bacterium]